MSDFQRSLIRSTVPMVAGLIITLFARVGIHGIDGTVTAYVTAAISAVYTTTAHFLERHFRIAGWLLGMPGPPKYQTPTKAA